MTDYCTAAELKAQIGKTLSGSDTVISAIISAASESIDNFCNRKDGFVTLDTATAKLFYGSGKPYQLIDESIEITKVEVKDSATDSIYTEWDTDDWIAFRGSPEMSDFNTLPYTGIMASSIGNESIFTSGQFSTRSGFRPITEGYRNVPTVRITAKWGYSETVPAVIKQACITQAARWFKRGESSWSDQLATQELSGLIFMKAGTFNSLDPDIKMMLVNGRFVQPSIGGLF